MKLPSLPIPSLVHTYVGLLEWVEPLIETDQFRVTKDVMSRFFEAGGEADKLQEKLQQWDKQLTGSWLKPLWDDLYLKYRGALPQGMNFNVLLDSEPYKQHRYTLSELVGKISYLVTELYHDIIDEKVAPELLKGTPLDMGQYKHFFRSVRIPSLERDQFYVADFDKRNNYVALLYKNHVYQVYVTNDNGAIFQSKKIAAAVEQIFQTEHEEGPNVGIFTTATRDQAANVYKKLSASKVNKRALHIIADSLVVISIDEESENAEEAIKNFMLHGANKYYDKTIQIILTKKGELGFNIEHTAVDGTTIFAVIQRVSDGICKQNSEIVYTDDAAKVEKLNWEITPDMQHLLKTFEQDNMHTRNDYYLRSEIFHAFGSNEIKQLQLSPDAFFHMALQLAQYRTFGSMKSVYEPVSVRSFYEGRTECARATSREKAKVVHAIDTYKLDPQQIYPLMKEASAAHSKRIGECRRGFGVERHMYGLEQMYHMFGKELGINKLPEIFTDKGYRALRHDFISTSGIAYANVKYRMFGPTVQGGFGLPYILLADSISINISSNSSQKDTVEQLTRHLVDALLELRQIAIKSID